MKTNKLAVWLSAIALCLSAFTAVEAYHIRVDLTQKLSDVRETSEATDAVLMERFRLNESNIRAVGDYAQGKRVAVSGLRNVPGTALNLTPTVPEATTKTD